MTYVWWLSWSNTHTSFHVFQGVTSHKADGKIYKSFLLWGMAAFLCTNGTFGPDLMRCGERLHRDCELLGVCERCETKQEKIDLDLDLEKCALVYFNMSLKYISQVFYSAGLPAIERYLNDKGPRKIATTEKNQRKYASFVVSPSM